MRTADYQPVVSRIKQLLCVLAVLCENRSSLNTLSIVFMLFVVCLEGLGRRLFIGAEPLGIYPLAWGISRIN
ncbi:unnamed protein product [Linum tenue]|uniref:Uncharacterized protein n=1 Tax=Linum tenue TaxID=586396 RepID=A0AAV0MDA5_9ROSI|nr:unnamed protein product [Linum tenue]